VLAAVAQHPSSSGRTVSVTLRASPEPSQTPLPGLAIPVRRIARFARLLRAVLIALLVLSLSKLLGSVLLLVLLVSMLMLLLLAARLVPTTVSPVLQARFASPAILPMTKELLTVPLLDAFPKTVISKILLSYVLLAPLDVHSAHPRHIAPSVQLDSSCTVTIFAILRAVQPASSKIR
jgi:hypothetical protein